MDTPLCYYCITPGTKLLSASTMTSSVLSRKCILSYSASGKKSVICEV